MTVRTMNYLTSNCSVEISAEDGRKILNDQEIAWENLTKRWKKPELFIGTDYFFDLKPQVARTFSNGS